MSMMSHDAAGFRSAAALPPFAFDDPSFRHTDEGYAFETALCLVEGQSPTLRPVSDAFPRGTSVRETQVLLDRQRLLEKLLAGVRGHLDASEWRALLDAADRVSDELASALAERAGAGGAKPRSRRWGDADQRRTFGLALVCRQNRRNACSPPTSCRPRSSPCRRRLPLPKSPG